MGKRQKAAAAALGALAAAGLVTGAAIDSPAQLTEENPIIVVEEDAEEEPFYPAQLKRKGLSAARQWILGLPPAVRSHCGVSDGFWRPELRRCFSALPQRRCSICWGGFAWG